MVAIVPQHVFQCTFDLALLPTKAIEPIPFGSPPRHAVPTPPRRKRCTKPHNIFQCSFDEVLLSPEPFEQTSSAFPELHGASTPPREKRCTKCQETKSVDVFTKRRESKDGLGSWCKQCKNMVSQERRLRERNARIQEALNALSAEELELQKTHKRCSKCQLWLPKSHFAANRRYRDGLLCWCYSCCAKVQAQYRTPERTRNFLLRYSYGMTRQQYDALLAEQGFVCACCKQPENSSLA